MVGRNERLFPKLRKKTELEAPTTLTESIKCAWDALTEQPQSTNKRLNQTPTRFTEFESQVWRKLFKTKSQHSKGFYLGVTTWKATQNNVCEKIL